VSQLEARPRCRPRGRHVSEAVLAEAVRREAAVGRSENPGSGVMILINIFAEKFSKKMAFLAQNKDKF
jgi:hypothetical protein